MRAFTCACADGFFGLDNIDFATSTLHERRHNADAAVDDRRSGRTDARNSDRSLVDDVAAAPERLTNTDRAQIKAILRQFQAYGK